MGPPCQIAPPDIAHPLGVKGFAYRRVKNDERDAADLADLLRMGRLPEAWIAPPELRELRELARRAKLVALHSGLKAQVHAVLAKEGVRVDVSDLLGRSGMELVTQTTLAPAYHIRVDSLLGLIDDFDAEIGALRLLVSERSTVRPATPRPRPSTGSGR
jgi:transposase